MSLFRKIFGASNPASDEEKENEYGLHNLATNAPLDEKFIYNFKKNGGKFLYCENASEIKDHFENILEENDWFENEALCYENKLFNLLDENKISYDKPKSPTFLLASCENLIADEGSILFSSNQIKQNKPNELPVNIIIVASISQIIDSKSDGLSVIKKKYLKDYPTNITTIKYFEKALEENFTHYGSTAKNLYLLLLEDY
jgi:hypothetical protein